ncbi:Hsp20/alpha crystallin family protein [Desulfolutivibrio sp.]|uniref:Hsp20/alpha crystallin family protein n=1 Tax=Desulfolutivibrio sp. TaxID=2773296 RepID=UPI002F96D542
MATKRDQAEERARRTAATPGCDPGVESGFLWSPTADVMETPEAFVIIVEAPGVAREDMTVELRGRSLWIRGERRAPRDGATGLYRMLERSHGPFARRFALPPGIVRDAATAILADGILEITVPKKGPEKIRRRIPIS